MSTSDLAAQFRSRVRQDRALLACVAGVGLLKAFATAIGVLTTLVLARLLGPSDFGIYAFALSSSFVVTLPVLQGLPTLVLREVAREPEERRALVSRTVLRFANKLVSVVGILLGLGGIGLIVARDWQGAELDLVLVFAALALPLAMVAGLVRSSVTRAYGFAVRGQLPDLLGRPLLFLGLLTVLWLAPVRSAWLAMVLHVVAALAAFLLAAALMPKLREGPASSAPSVSTLSWLKALFPLSTVAGIQVVISQIDTIALGVFATEADVGVYRIATSLALQVSFGLTIVNLVAAPKFASLYREGRLDELQSLNRTGGLTSSLIGGFVLIVYAFFGESLIELTVGPAFLPAFIPLMILSVAHLATLWAGTTNVLLNMIGRERDVLVAGLIAMAVSATMNILLVPSFAAIGAACASALALLAWRGVLSWFLSRHLATGNLRRGM